RARRRSPRASRYRREALGEAGLLRRREHGVEVAGEHAVDVRSAARTTSLNEPASANCSRIVAGSSSTLPAGRYGPRSRRRCIADSWKNVRLSAKWRYTVGTDTPASRAPPAARLVARCGRAGARPLDPRQLR